MSVSVSCRSALSYQSVTVQAVFSVVRHSLQFSANQPVSIVLGHSCLPVSVVCQCQLSASVSSLPVSVICQCQLSASVSWQPVSVVNQCQFSASVSYLPVSVVSQCQFSGSVSSLPVSVFCQCQLSASVSCQPMSVLCQCQLSASVSCQPVSVVSQCQFSAGDNCQPVSVICQCQLSASVTCLPVSVVSQCQLSVLTVVVQCRLLVGVAISRPLSVVWDRRQLSVSVALSPGCDMSCRSGSDSSLLHLLFPRTQLSLAIRQTWPDWGTAWLRAAVTGTGREPPRQKPLTELVTVSHLLPDTQGGIGDDHTPQRAGERPKGRPGTNFISFIILLVHKSTHTADKKT